MDRIETITPVHVGTGEMIPAFCFQRVSNSKNYHRYNVSDIYAQIPSSILLNKSFLESLRLPKQGQSVKSIMNDNILGKVNYSKLRPIYDVTFDDVSTLEKKFKDIDEQTKDLNGPYIPGSSIKGAILNAWKYYLLKTMYTENNVAYVLKNTRNLNNPTIVNLILGDAVDHKDFVAALQSCVFCEDIHFSKLQVLQGSRIGGGKSKQGRTIAKDDVLAQRNMDGELPLNFAECISKGQYSKGNVFIIDENRKKFIRENLTEFVGTSVNSNVLECYKKLLDQFTKENIVKACNEFTKAVVGLETAEEYDDLYYYSYLDGINESILKISNKLKALTSSNKKEYYIRLGKHTNYFNKCVSLLIKENSPNLYEKYFKDVFSPVSNVKKVNVSRMPKTRSIYFNKSGYEKADYTNDNLLGFIKVTYD